MTKNMPPMEHPKTVIAPEPIGAPSRFNRRGLSVLMGLLTLAVLVNASFFFLVERADQVVLTPLDIESQQITIVVPLDERRMVAATVDDRLLLLEDGQPLQEKQFDAVIGSVDIAPTGDTIYVGTGDGRVTAFNMSFQVVNEAKVAGRVVGVKATSAGELFVAHGVAIRTDRFYVSYFPTPGAEPAFTKKAEFTIYGLDAVEGIAYYGTGNSRVVTLGADGEVQWITTVPFPVIRMMALPDLGQLLVSDEDGGLTLLSAQGQTIWHVKPTGFRLQSLGFDPRAMTYLAGDVQGTLVALDPSGTILSSAKAGESRIVALVPTGAGRMTVVPQDGQWFTLNAGAMRGAGQADQLRLRWIIVEIALLLLILTVLTRTIESWWVGLCTLAWRMRRAYIFYLFIFPSLSLVLLFSYYPAGLAFYTSFTNMSLRRVTEFIGMENYVTIFTQDIYFRAGFLNLVVIAITGVLKTVTVPLFVAELIYWLRNQKSKYLFRTLFVFPAVVPGLVTILLWRMIYDPNIGLLNRILPAVGLSQFQTAWLGNEKTALWAIIGAGFPYVEIFALLIYLGGLMNINLELYDAAHIDGANWWSRFWRIDVPLLESQFRLLLFFTFAGSIAGFANIWIFTRGGPGYVTYTPALEMYRQLIDTEYGYSSAIGVILFIMSFIATVVILRFRRDETVESVI